MIEPTGQQIVTLMAALALALAGASLADLTTAIPDMERLKMQGLVRLAAQTGTSANQDPECLLSASRVAGMLDCGEKYVYELARDRVLPSVRLGKKYIRFRRSDVDAYMKTGSVDGHVDQWYSPRDGRGRATASQKARGIDPGGARRAPGSQFQHGRSLGAGRKKHLGANGSPDPGNDCISQAQV